MMKTILWIADRRVTLIIIKRIMRLTLMSLCRCRRTNRAMTAMICMMIAKAWKKTIPRAFTSSKMPSKFQIPKRSYPHKMTSNCPTTWKVARVGRGIRQPWIIKKKSPKAPKISRFINRLQMKSITNRQPPDYRLNWNQMRPKKVTGKNRIKWSRRRAILPMTC